MANPVPDRGGADRAINLRRNGIKVGYEHFKEDDGDSFTCDNCNTVHTEGYDDGNHTICAKCASQKYDENDWGSK
jgi:hypothetical protein